MPKSIYIQFLSEQSNSNPHYLNRLIKFLNHFIAIEPNDKPSGFECHHIVPKSWKPEWSKEPDNLLKVPSKAHYIIHHLLWRAFPLNVSMIRAFWMFSVIKEQKISAKIYETLRQRLSDSQRESMKR